MEHIQTKANFQTGRSPNTNPQGLINSQFNGVYAVYPRKSKIFYLFAISFYSNMKNLVVICPDIFFSTLPYFL